MWSTVELVAVDAVAGAGVLRRRLSEQAAAADPAATRAWGDGCGRPSSGTRSTPSSPRPEVLRLARENLDRVRDEIRARVG
jgi:hypothetical protein